MKFLLILLTFTFFLVDKTEKISILGTWKSESDRNSLIKFGKDSYSEIYKGKVIFSGKYTRTFYSCDTNYRSNKIIDKRLDFIKYDDGTCYEIIGLSKKTLSRRHSASGSIEVFYKTQ